MARISNGPCRLTGADGIEMSNFLVFVFVFVFSSPAIADRRMKEVNEKKLFFHLEDLEFLTRVGSAT